MASCTTDREPQQRGANGVDQVVQFVVTLLLDTDLGDVGVADARGQKPGGHPGQGITGSQFVSGQLPTNEAIKRHVVIERPDHKIAKVVRVGIVQVVLEPVALGKTHHVQPVTPPSLSHVWTRQQAIDQSGPRIRMGVRQETFTLPGCRWQSRQVETDAAEQNGRVGIACGLSAGLLDPPQNEPIDRVDRPVGVSHVGNGEPQWLERPEPERLVGDQGCHGDQQDSQDPENGLHDHQHLGHTGKRLHARMTHRGHAFHGKM